jgi:3-oxoacyl-[acyl-carrier protein] reductase
VPDRFSDRVAIVTGSSRGIGLAVARRLGREGAAVVVNSRSQEELDDACASLRDDDIEVTPAPGDMLDPETPSRLVDVAVSAYGRVDHVVNTVGINSLYGPVLKSDRDRFVRILEGNVWTPVALAQAAMAAGLAERRGSIVNVSTIGARQIQPMLAAYCASKAALELAMRILAREVGPLGVRVNTVAPGLVRTEMSRVLWDAGRGDAEEAFLPLQRLGRPEDIAAAVAFLLSDDAAWITGITLDVDGGRLLMGDEPHNLMGDFSGRDPYVHRH